MATKKTETAKARFQEAIDAYKELCSFDYVTPLEEFLDKPLPERDRVQKSFLKGLKTRLDPEADHSLKLAFKAADLDPQDPLDREVLLRLFASAYFPRHKTRGAKTKWTPERWSQLLSDYDQVKKDSPNLNDEKICEKIIKRFGSRYPKQSPGTLRRNLASARVSVDTIDRMVKRGELPPPVKLSPRVLGWRRRDVYPIMA
jgi:hypothetical protein